MDEIRQCTEALKKAVRESDDYKGAFVIEDNNNGGQGDQGGSGAGGQGTQPHFAAGTNGGTGGAGGNGGNQNPFLNMGFTRLRQPENNK